MCASGVSYYRVFKKEGGKVKGYYTTKKLILGAFKGFIVTVRIGHLINCIKLPKNFTFKLKIRPLNIQRKMAKNTLFNPNLPFFNSEALFQIIRR